jgi:hypothetical protein
MEWRLKIRNGNKVTIPAIRRMIVKSRGVIRAIPSDPDKAILAKTELAAKAQRVIKVKIPIVKWLGVVVSGFTD